MNLLELYLMDTNDYPRFKRKNKWADRFLVKLAGISFIGILLKISIDFSIESFR